ncbi:MAG TPA: alpha/beta fold hydrolase [Pseudonocardiaceae bacterium]|jgi:pimeloyl-ACP methyl ester carboxylesterase|nr:alpha/beta fold hydrolase [Pseudonocardiaceae bacterium]
MTTDVHTATLHGHPVRYRLMRTGRRGRAAREVVVLLHGLAGTLDTWTPVLTELAGRRDDRTVIAVDLAGHGGSTNRDADCSPGGYASGVRDLLASLGFRHATLVGHSLGGAVALQFAYQFPDWCDRLVLVASGGLGRSVHPVLRVATLPGSEFALPFLAHRAVVATARRLLGITGAVGLTRSPEPLLYLEHLAALADSAGRDTFSRTVRGALDLHGQRLTGTDRLYLMGDMPTLVVWGDKDPIIPVGHARRAQQLIPRAEVAIFPGSGHFPHCHRPERFTGLLVDFLHRTQPARIDPVRALRAATERNPLAAAG